MRQVDILRGKIRKRIYIGSSNDVERRLKEHNQGKVRSTKGCRPLELIKVESFNNDSEARKRELFYKTASGRRILRRIIS